MIVGAVASLVTLWQLRDHSLVTGVLPGIRGAWGAGEGFITRFVLRAPRLSALLLLAGGIACLLAFAAID